MIKQPKLSFDLSEENRAFLESEKAKKSIKFGPYLNTLIELFGRIPPDVKKELLEFVKKRISELYASMDTASEYEVKALANRSDYYRKLARYFNDDKEIFVTAHQEQKMQKLLIKDGVLICPNDFIILNPEEASYYDSAYVVAVNNAQGVPHMIYLLEEGQDPNFNPELRQIINRKCISVFPRFKEILQNEVKAIYDPDEPAICLNAKEVKAAPQVGYFELYVKGSMEYTKDYEPPLGAMIIRN